MDIYQKGIFVSYLNDKYDIKIEGSVVEINELFKNAITIANFTESKSIKVNI